MSYEMLNVSGLSVSVEKKQILNNINLKLQAGQVHAIMGPNGSGKSSLALSIMGHPRYVITSGSINFMGNELQELSPDKRAQLGLFLGMQNPYEIEGIPYKDFLRQAYNTLYDGTEKQLRIRDFHKMLLSRLELLNIDESFINRSLNVGFSGGEKKRAEMLQLAVLQPKLAFLDEIDSGLDVDALKIVCSGLAFIRQNNPLMGVVLITHYPRILQYLEPDVVHIMHQGSIVRSGSAALAQEVDRSGFQGHAQGNH